MPGRRVNNPEIGANSALATSRTIYRRCGGATISPSRRVSHSGLAGRLAKVARLISHTRLRRDIGKDRDRLRALPILPRG